MEHAWPHLTESFAGLIFTFLGIGLQMRWTLDMKIGVTDVGCVVNCEADWDHYIDKYDHVEGQIPVVKPSNQT